MPTQGEINDGWSDVPRQPLRILTVANVPPDPNSGAAGTVYHTNSAFRCLGHTVDSIWADDLGPRRISHGNLHSLLEQPRNYWREVSKAVACHEYDVVMVSQPQGYLVGRQLKRQGFPGVIVNRSHGLELRADAALPKWHKALGVPQNRFPRNLFSKPLQSLLTKQWNDIVRYMDGIVVPCEMDRLFLKDTYPKDAIPIRTIHHGVSDSILSRSVLPFSDQRRNKILHVGQFSFFKGPHVTAQILNHLFARTSKLSMTWVTSPDGCDQARRLISSEHRSRIRWVPWTSQEELLDIFDEHGIFLFPTLCEGAAKSALEAMARGMCVVASDDSGTHDYIKDFVNGRVCPVGDVDAFVSAILDVVSDEQAPRMAAAAANYAHAKTWRVCGAELEGFFRELLAKKR
ncbi:glycosyltransferase family 4 protein [Stieleria varia]|uniref:UDP-D-galactose:(Glucosyl)lipopolysaccharide-1, 6-D-galactosyltransferase n=1 Tax=Stieleria varia TaxID=2528005 RepID=A0A5C6B223_9BACT|nr:glycosyltransferase family 4 protein [Stieleria varia]TWU05950.1 UDP-D-galactose:(glucosyl)lipopolysaccharide-1,6-D-galactosyltransferase [Stieleria varia]